MRIAITGATGNIGTSTVKALATEPAVDRVIGIARRQPEWSPPNVDFIADDIRSDRLVTHLRGIDVLVHLAWAFQPTHQPLNTWHINVIGGIAALEAAIEAGVGTIVYVSSVGAYSPGHGRRVDESWPTHSTPTAAYGREKAYLERYLDAFELRHSQVRLVWLRPCFVFKRESGSEQRRIFAGPLLPRGLLKPGRLGLLPVPKGLAFQAVHADDVAEAVRLAVVSEARGAFNIATDPAIDRSVLGELLEARTVEVPAGVATAAIGGAWRLHLVPADNALLELLLTLPLLDSSRARQELGWRPHHTGVEALREMLGGLVDGAGAATAPLHPDDTRTESRSST